MAPAVQSRERRGLSHYRSTLDTTASSIVVIAAAAVIWLTVSTWHGRVNTVPTTAPPKSPLPDARQSLKGAQLLGSTEARVAIIEYSDFQCSFCARFSKHTWPLIKKEYVDTGKVLMVFRHLPSGRYSKSAAISAECAGEQGQFWQMYDGLFTFDGEVDETTGKSMAQQLRLDMTAFDQCSKGEVVAKIDSDKRIARSLRLLGTPTFLIGRIARDQAVEVLHVLVGDYSFDNFKEILDQALIQRDR